MWKTSEWISSWSNFLLFTSNSPLVFTGGLGAWRSRAGVSGISAFTRESFWEGNLKPHSGALAAAHGGGGGGWSGFVR